MNESSWLTPLTLAAFDARSPSNGTSGASVSYPPTLYDMSDVDVREHVNFKNATHDSQTGEITFNDLWKTCLRFSPDTTGEGIRYPIANELCRGGGHNYVTTPGSITVVPSPWAASDSDGKTAQGCLIADEPVDEEDARVVLGFLSKDLKGFFTKAVHLAEQQASKCTGLRACPSIHIQEILSASDVVTQLTGDGSGIPWEQLPILVAMADSASLGFESITIPTDDPPVVPGEPTIKIEGASPGASAFSRGEGEVIYVADMEDERSASCREA
jgi:hypothetical protein